MPRLSTLAKESVYFAHAVSPCSWTKPAIASVFTSLYVDAHKVIYNADPADASVQAHKLPESIETMATFLRKAGYATVGIQTNGNLHPDFGFGQGFDVYDFHAGDPAADKVTPMALEKLPSLKSPFFLYVHYMDPHGPYTPPEKYKAMLGPIPELEGTDANITALFSDYVNDQAFHYFHMTKLRSLSPLSESAREIVKALYAAEVRSADDEIGRLIDTVLREYPNSVLIVMSDHGEEFWDRGFLGHGSSVYQEQTEVPLIIHAPGLSPIQIDVPVSTIDVLPTMAAYLKLSPNPIWQGSDVFAPERQAKLAEEKIFSHTYSLYPRMNVDTESIRVKNAKLVLKRKINKTELYDLVVDPGEKNDLSAQRLKETQLLTDLLNSHREQNERHAPSLQSETAPLDQELIDELKTHGYLK